MRSRLVGTGLLTLVWVNVNQLIELLLGEHNDAFPTQFCANEVDCVTGHLFTA